MASIIEQILAVDTIRAAEQARFDAIPYPADGHARRLHVGPRRQVHALAVDPIRTATAR